jgi:RNA 3'-terminal phosphate cyclase
MPESRMRYAATSLSRAIHDLERLKERIENADFIAPDNVAGLDGLAGAALLAKHLAERVVEMSEAIFHETRHFVHVAYEQAEQEPSP